MLFKKNILVIISVVFCQLSFGQAIKIDRIAQPSYPAPVNVVNPPELVIDFTYNTAVAPFYLSFYAKFPPGSRQPIDLLQSNIYMPLFGSSRSLQVPIDLSNYQDQYFFGQQIDSFEIGILLFDTLLPLQKLEDPFFVQNYVNFLPKQKVFPTIIDFGMQGVKIDTALINLLKNFLIIPENTVTKNDTTRSVVRGCGMPNLNLDSSKHNSDTEPGYAGDWNACVPVSCANSFQWLEQRHPFKLKSGLSHREKLKEFSKLMNRDTNEGVHTKPAIEGKLAFVDKYKLPVHVKYQSYSVNDSCVNSPDSSYKTRHCAKNKMGKNNRIDFNWIFSEMEKGEDVEMFVQYDYKYICPGKDDSIVSFRHALTLVDIIESGNTKRFHFKDDSLQGGPSGTRESIVSYDTTTTGYGYIKEWSKTLNMGGGKQLVITTFVTDVLSESLDTTVKFITKLPKILKNQNYSFKINGNPSPNGNFSLVINSLKSTAYEMRILNASGQIVYEKNIAKYNDNSRIINVRSLLKPGVYIVQLNSNGESMSKKLLVY